MRIEMLKQIMSLFEDEKKQVMLVYHPIERKYYVQKLIQKPYTVGIYETLMAHPHPNLATIYAVEEAGEQLSIVEEFINGCTLEYEMSARDMQEEECMKIILQVMDVCIHLHKQEPPIIHRDIKPSNILFLQDRIKLIDFEISRKYDDNQRKDTQTLGSVGYAAPEQYGFSQSDPRTDVYAIGVLLNELLTKEKPNDMLAKGKYKKIISTCIHMDPKQRYQSVEMLRQVFERLIPHHFKSNHARVITKRCVAFYTILVLFCSSAFSTSNTTPISDSFLYSIIVFFIIALIRWVAIDSWGIRNIIPCPFKSEGLIVIHAIITWCILSFLMMIILFLLRDVISSMLRAYQLQYQIM